jgi:hypothetical protein
MLLHLSGKVIRTTADHPFSVQGKGWMPADHLQARDLLHTQDGQDLHVQAVTPGDEEQVVYNNLPLPGSTPFFPRLVIGVVAGTPILTPKGPVPIEELRPGDFIQLGPDGSPPTDPGADHPDDPELSRP